MESKFLKASQRNPEIIAKYSMVDIKHSIEQNTRHVLVLDYKYKEDHSHLNVHLVLGYIAAISSIGSATYSYTIGPFEEALTKWILIVGCSIYFICQGILMYYNKYIKSDTIFVGYKDNEKVIVNLDSNKFSDIVTLSIILEKNGKKYHTSKVKKSVGEWYSTMGEFVAPNFLKDMNELMVGETKKSK